MSSIHNVTRSITHVMQLITIAGTKAARHLIGDDRVSVQRQQKQPLAGVYVFPDFRNSFGTDIAIEQFALKAQITILERREQ
jgi:hypothetical protein